MEVRLLQGALGLLERNDEDWMREALREARKAEAEGEVPVGAVIVFDGGIIARAHNQRELLHDPTAHAEMIALTQAAEHLSNWRLTGARMFVTLEPCAMCAGALVLARVQEVVWATPDPRAGAVESVFRIWEEPRLNHRVRSRADSLRSNAATSKSFFRKKRTEPTSRSFRYSSISREGRSEPAGRRRARCASGRQAQIPTLPRN